MKRLTQQDRAHLAGQLLNALLPNRADEIRGLRDAAFAAVVANYFTPAGLCRIASLPPEWLNKVTHVHVRATGNPEWRILRGEPRLLPRQPDDMTPLCDAAQAAVDRWHAAVTADEQARKKLRYRLDKMLADCRTLEQLLERLPEARDILSLPPPESADAIAEDVRAQIAATQGGAS